MDTLFPTHSARIYPSVACVHHTRLYKRQTDKCLHHNQQKMKNTITIILSIILTGFFHHTQAQVAIEANADNFNVIGSELFFDIYFKTTAGSSGNLYFDNADLVLTLDPAAFNNPTFQKEGSGQGFCTFEPTNNTAPNMATTRALYFSNTAASLIGNELIININGPAPKDQAEFDEFVASIDGAGNTHKLGRFKVTGVVDAGAALNLQWKTSGTGLVTKIFSLEDAPPFHSGNVSNVTYKISNALPLELISFEANSLDEKTVSLTWKTFNENQVSHFEIQKSLDSKNWITLGKTTAKGFSTTPQSYHFTDLSPQQGSNLYRLKIVENNAEFVYSQVRIVDFDKIISDIVQIFPNPVRDILQVNLHTTTPNTTHLRILNEDGKEVFAKENPAFANNSLELELSDLPKGVYLMNLTTKHESFSTTFVKQ